jgi:hypothetical protein
MNKKDIKQMGEVTISRNGYIEELEEALRQEREIADALAVELSSCHSSISWVFNEDISKALKRWREARKIS